MLATLLAFLAVSVVVICTPGQDTAVYAFAIDRLRRILAGPARRALDALTGAVLVLLGARLAAESR